MIGEFTLGEAFIIVGIWGIEQRVCRIGAQGVSGKRREIAGQSEKVAARGRRPSRLNLVGVRPNVWSGSDRIMLKRRRRCPSTPTCAGALKRVALPLQR